MNIAKKQANKKAVTYILHGCTCIVHTESILYHAVYVNTTITVKCYIKINSLTKNNNDAFQI